LRTGKIYISVCLETQFVRFYTMKIDRPWYPE
jgi:hypothetical protein